MKRSQIVVPKVSKLMKVRDQSINVFNRPGYLIDVTDTGVIVQYPQGYVEMNIQDLSPVPDEVNDIYSLVDELSKLQTGVDSIGDRQGCYALPRIMTPTIPDWAIQKYGKDLAEIYGTTIINVIENSCISKIKGFQQKMEFYLHEYTNAYVHYLSFRLSKFNPSQYRQVIKSWSSGSHVNLSTADGQAVTVDLDMIREDIFLTKFKYNFVTDIIRDCEDMLRQYINDPNKWDIVVKGEKIT